MAETMPAELSQLCLASLGLPVMMLDADEMLVYANEAAYKVHPILRASSGRVGDKQYHVADLIKCAAFNDFDISTSYLARDSAGERPFSLSQTFSDSTTKGHAVYNDNLRQASHCQPLIRLQNETDQNTWWKASISNFPTENERSHYYSIVLISMENRQGHANVQAPEPLTPASSGLSRPPIQRKISEPIRVPGDIPSLTERVADPEGMLEELENGFPKDFYKSAVENMPQIMFCTDKQGVVTYLNPQWYRYTGWPINGGSPELWANVYVALHYLLYTVKTHQLKFVGSICPADVDQAVVAYGAAVREGRELELQYRVRAADGSFGWMLLRGTCIRDPETKKVSGYVCTLTQGDDLINARSEAVQARKYITTVLKSSGLALLVVNLQGTVMLYEGDVPALESIGVSSEHLLNQKLDKVWPHRECNVQVERMLAAYQSPSVAEQEFCASSNGLHFRYRLSAIYETQQDASQAMSAVAIVCTDITAMVNAELALRKSQEERAALLVSENAAREASRLKTAYVTSLSHEIRTPISGMIGISELLLSDRDLQPKQRELVHKQLQAGEMLLQLVSMVLDIGKMEANKLEIEKAPFFLKDLLNSLEIFASLAAAKKIHFTRNILSPSDTYLVGDKLRLAQVLSNFISNAIKFTSTGGVTLTVSVAEEGSNPVLLCEVVDTGVGIDAATVPHLFQPFHQADVSTARLYGGSGLGLSIAKSLTELMNGSVLFDSTLGVGTKVKLQIPLEKGPDNESTVASGRFERRDSTSSERSVIRILLVEDNKLLQDIYAALITRMGFPLLTVASDGQEALACVEAQPFDLVLMDIELPKMTGPEAVAVIRQHPKPAIRNLRIIALTANAMAGDEVRFLNMGMNAYLAKPVRASALEQAIIKQLF